MTASEQGSTGNADSPSRGTDTESALQRELKREEQEGSATIGDMSADRNLSGSSSWTTLPIADRGTVADAASVDSADESRRTARNEVADRLARRGVSLSGHETDEDLVEILEAVERFEAAVEARGGDLMVDEPVGNVRSSEPDDQAFVLPERTSGQSVASFIERIAEARDRVLRGPRAG